MSDLPQQVMVWHGYTDLEHIGMWSTTRYPEDAVAYVPLARLEAVEKERDAAIAAMSEQARKRGEAEGRPQASELAGIVEGWKSRAERAEAALHGPIKPITQDDMANIIAHLSPDLEPAGPLPNRNSVMMALIKVKNAHKAALATARAALAAFDKGGKTND